MQTKIDREIDRGILKFQSTSLMKTTSMYMQMWVETSEDSLHRYVTTHDAQSLQCCTHLRECTSD